MDDLISRREAVKAIRDAVLAWSSMPQWREDKIVDAVKHLPPAQPECEDAVSREAVLNELDAWEKDLKEICHHETAADLKLIKQSMESLPSAQPSATDTNVATKDTISRAMALKGLEDLNIASFYEENEHSREAYTEVKAMLKALPPAQPSVSKTEIVGDVISRAAALDALADYIHNVDRVYSTGKLTHNDCMDAAHSVLDALPPAQPEPIRINLNEKIKVKLTDWGKEIYYHQYDRTNQIAGRKICEPEFPKEDENGYTEFQLWAFIELYGEHIGVTLPNVIKPNEIIYER